MEHFAGVMMLVGRGSRITERLRGELSFKRFYLWIGRIPAEPLEWCALVGGRGKL
jgi:hypothetical protein